MAEKPQSYYGTWINRQRSLLPGLVEEFDPLTTKLEHLIIILDTLGLEAFVAPPRPCSPGFPVRLIMTHDLVLERNPM